MHLLSLSPVPILHFCSAIFFIMYEDTLTFFMFKKLTLAEIEVFLNIGQIATVFIGALVLPNENVTFSLILRVFIMFAGVLLIILGKRDTIASTESVESAKGFNLWIYALMATAPVAMVLINIPMATLRILNQVTIPFYMCVISTVVYGLWNILNRSHFMPTEDEFKVHSKMLFWVLTIIVNGPCYNLAW